MPYMKQYTSVSERTAASISDRYPRGSDAGPGCSSAFDDNPANSLLAVYGAMNVADGRRDTPSGYVGCYRHCGEQLFPLSIMFTTIFLVSFEGPSG